MTMQCTSAFSARVHRTCDGAHRRHLGSAHLLFCMGTLTIVQCHHRWCNGLSNALVVGVHSEKLAMYLSYIVSCAIRLRGQTQHTVTDLTHKVSML